MKDGSLVVGLVLLFNYVCVHGKFYCDLSTPHDLGGVLSVCRWVSQCQDWKTSVLRRWMLVSTRITSMLAECEVFQSFPMVLSLVEAEQSAFVMISEESVPSRGVTASVVRAAAACCSKPFLSSSRSRGVGIWIHLSTNYCSMVLLFIFCLILLKSGILSLSLCHIYTHSSLSINLCICYFPVYVSKIIYSLWYSERHQLNFRNLFYF